jgi:hypothetical protein
MPFDTAAKNVMIAAAMTDITAVGIHSGDPGTGADNEISGSGYARQTPTFGSASGGVVTLTSTLNYDGPASANALWYSLWAGSTRYGKGQITSGDTAFNVDGKFRLLSGTTFTVA